MVVGHSTCKRSAAEFTAEVRHFIEEHGRPPRNSSSLVGTSEYRLRSKVQYQMKKGLFSEAEQRELDRLLKGSASAEALQTGDSASQQTWSAAAATALPPGAVSEVAAPMAPRSRLPSTLLSALGATASARARRYRGKGRFRHLLQGRRHKAARPSTGSGANPLRICNGPTISTSKLRRRPSAVCTP